MQLDGARLLVLKATNVRRADMTYDQSETWSYSLLAKQTTTGVDVGFNIYSEYSLAVIYRWNLLKQCLINPESRVGLDRLFQCDIFFEMIRFF